jgi:hypothetical protein
MPHALTELKLDAVTRPAAEPAARAEELGLLRRGGLAFFFPGRGTAVLNVTHIEAPLDPVAASREQPGAHRSA